MKAEVGVTSLKMEEVAQAKVVPLEAGKDKDTESLCNTWIFDFWPPELEENKSVLG